MKKLRFVWIDDQKQKVESFRAAIETGIASSKLSASIELIEVKKGLLDTLSSWTDKNTSNPPHLFIIDHVFNPELPFTLKGSSVAHLLRNILPSVPMVCVTAKLDKPDTFDQEDLSEYTAIFPYTGLSDDVEDLYVIARDFPKLSPSDANVREHTVSCLKEPARDHQDLLLILPEEFQTQKHATTEHRIARWIFNVFLPRPGFVYDKLYMATLLGLSEAGFEKVEQLFDKALYKGVFVRAGKPRWWVSEARRILFAKTDPEGPDAPQLAGRTLPGITDADHSVCYVSKKSDPPPDAVVFADETRDAERRVVHRQYSKQHPNDPGTTLGFETRLVLATRRLRAR